MENNRTKKEISDLVIQYHYQKMNSYLLGWVDHSHDITERVEQVYNKKTYINLNQLGQDIDGEAQGDYSGHSVALSSNGRIVAIGARLNDGVNGVNSGHGECTNGMIMIKMGKTWSRYRWRSSI